jgi:histidinol-phosphate aminotransferase
MSRPVEDDVASPSTPDDASARRPGATARVGADVGPVPVPVTEPFTPYAWAPQTAEVAARAGLRREEVLRFDQNTPPLPGVPRVPLGESLARLNEYPDGHYRALRQAAAAYVGKGVSWSQVVIGAGADDLILLCARTFLGPGRRAAVDPPTYALYRIATELAGAACGREVDGASVIWRCNPNNPTGAVAPAADLLAMARAHPRALVVVDEAYVEFGGDSVVSWVGEVPNLVVVRTLSKAFGLAALRVGYAVAAPEVAAVLEARRAPAPVAGPAARIAAAALRAACFDVAESIEERERVRLSLVAAGFAVPAGAGNFVWLPTEEPLGERLESQGIVVRRFAEGIRITLRRPSENDVLLRALGAEPGSPPGRTATVIRTTSETALRLTIGLDGAGTARVATGIGFLDHLLTLLAFHADLDLDCVAGEHHTVEDVLAALGEALAQALGSREGMTRYGSAVVPMDEARATATVDLVRRPHAEISLAFTGDRVGGLALSLLPHALERFAMEARCTVHVEAAGDDDHHVAEAAFKALGRALRTAVALGGDGIRSTKGAA